MASQPSRQERRTAARENARGYEVIATQTTITRSAPLPLAGELFEYENVIPGGAERILKMAENQSAHRIELEKLIVVNQQKQSWRGQTMALSSDLAVF